MSNLPIWARDIVCNPPSRGEGLNPWLLRASLTLRRCGRTEDEISAELRILTAGEPLKPGEIARAVGRSKDYFTNDGDSMPRAEKWPAIDKEARARIVAAYPADVAELWEQSPYRFADDEPLTESIIDWLFPGNPLICAAPIFNKYETAPRESFRGRLAEFQFIVPSAMSKPLGLTQEGKESARCLDNTGPRQHVIVEQDSGTADEQAAVIMHLAERAPLALVVRSGGKSLHSWFVCGEQSELTVLCFFRYAVTLGADRATWTRCQLVRMPDGTRRKPDGTTTRQSVLYWNPSNTEAAA